jgi:hypothetical protein
MKSGNRFGTGLDDERLLAPWSTSAAGNAAGRTTALPTYCSGFSSPMPAVTVLLG